ncbi:MAG: PAS domain-containing protein [Dehalococcoidales bacterium]|nr:PAS domain-containing protein [Dehalococcoidales bacterium]
MLHEYTLSIESPSLQLSNEEYRDILMNAPIGIFTATPEGKILGMNPAFVGMLGYDSSHELIESVEDIGRHLYADPEARKEMMNCLEKNGGNCKFESRL